MKRSVTAVFLTGAVIMLITMSNQAKQGAIEGINLCVQIIIPALLPILILTNMIMKSSGASVFEHLFGWFAEKVLKLPRCACCAVIFGLIGGYPAGTVLTAGLYEKGLIDKTDAKRIMSFNLCGGLAFIVTAVGEICLASKKIGWILYLCNLLAALIIAIFGGIFSKKRITTQTKAPLYLNLGDAMVEAVDCTVNSLLAMSCYIILFSALSSMVNLPVIITPIIEITNGICKDPSAFTIPQCAAFLAFGGFCIHFQLMGFLRKMEVGYLHFLLFRVIAAVLAYLAAFAYLRLFPQSAEVFSNMAPVVTISATQVNAGLSTIMIIGCAVLVFDIEGKKIKLSNAK